MDALLATWNLSSYHTSENARVAVFAGEQRCLGLDFIHIHQAVSNLNNYNNRKFNYSP